MKKQKDQSTGVGASKQDTLITILGKHNLPKLSIKSSEFDSIYIYRDIHVTVLRPRL